MKAEIWEDDENLLKMQDKGIVSAEASATRAKPFPSLPDSIEVTSIERSVAMDIYGFPDDDSGNRAAAGLIAMTPMLEGSRGRPDVARLKARHRKVLSLALLFLEQHKRLPERQELIRARLKEIDETPS